MSYKATTRKCVDCGTPTESGTTSLTFERDGIQIVISGVPAETCPNGHEPFLDANVFEALGAGVTELTKTLIEASASRLVAPS